MQEQEGISQSPDYAVPEARPFNSDAYEQRLWQEERDYPPYEEHAYAEGYAAQNVGDGWFREDEKLRPRQSRRYGIEWLALFLVLLCAFLIVGSIAGFIISWLSWSLIACLIVVGAAVVIAQWHVVVQPMPVQTFQVMEHAQLVVNNASGTIVLRRGEDSVVTVAATKRVSGIGTGFDNMQAQCEQQGDRVNVSTSLRWSIFQLGFRTFDLEITVPEQCDVQLVNGSGKVIAGGIRGAIKLRTGSGRIEVSSLQGRIALKTGSGSVAVVGLSGQATCTTGSGRIEIGQAMLTGSSSFQTGSGSIRFDGALDPRGQFQFKTGSGSVRLMLPLNAAVNVRAKTGSGAVVNEFGNAAVSNGPRAQLSIKTGSGGIYVQKGQYTA